jgi:hypothetical protein
MFGFNGIFGAKPRRFDYKPRYYDLEQEAREQRKREVLGDDYADKYKTDEQKEAEKRGYKPGVYIRNSAMARRGIERSPRSNGGRTRRLVFIGIILVAAAVWLMTTGSIDDFFTRWLAK